MGGCVGRAWSGWVWALVDSGGEGGGQVGVWVGVWVGWCIHWGGGGERGGRVCADARGCVGKLQLPVSLYDV